MGEVGCVGEAPAVVVKTYAERPVIGHAGKTELPDMSSACCEGIELGVFLFLGQTYPGIVILLGKSESALRRICLC
jgi:hypothetical protein